MRREIPSIGTNRIRLIHLSAQAARDAVFAAGQQVIREGAPLALVDSAVAAAIVDFVGQAEDDGARPRRAGMQIEPALLSVMRRPSRPSRGVPTEN